MSSVHPGSSVSSPRALWTIDCVIEASWEALVDSLEAGMLPGRAQRTLAAQASPRAAASAR